ncbi:cell division cycle-associated protein 3 isoform X2 [Ascaphus truei]
MGSAESREQVTPSRPLCNRHLSHVTDPRSPTAGIHRTPIEIGGSARITPQSTEEEVQEPTVTPDPRSPTHQIARTPLRPSIPVSIDLLAKQLSEVFVAEDSGMEGSSVVGSGPETPPSVEQGGEEAPAAPVEEDDGGAQGEQAEGPAAEPTVSAEPASHVGQSQRARGKSPRAAGGKNARQRSRKGLVSVAPGRSPLKILQEDNSPNTGVQQRQGKKLSFLPEGGREPVSSLRALKISHSSWERSHNKENTLYGQTES